MATSWNRRMLLFLYAVGLPLALALGLTLSSGCDDEKSADGTDAATTDTDEPSDVEDADDPLDDRDMEESDGVGSDVPDTTTDGASDGAGLGHRFLTWVLRYCSTSKTTLPSLASSVAGTSSACV